MAPPPLGRDMDWIEGFCLLGELRSLDPLFAGIRGRRRMRVFTARIGAFDVDVEQLGRKRHEVAVVACGVLKTGEVAELVDRGFLGFGLERVGPSGDGGGPRGC
jgi:hypothetical protein